MSDESNKSLPSDLNEMSEDWWCDERVCRLLSQAFGDHIVGLLVAYLKKGEQGYALFTGFLYEHRGFPFWISAGHVVDELDRIRRSNDFGSLKVKWVDMSNSDPDGDDGIPMDLDHLHFLPFDSQGVDVGICTFAPYYYDLLKANKENTFLDENVCFEVADAKPEGFYLVGYPDTKHESSQRNLSSGGTRHRLNALIYCLPLKQLEDRPNDPHKDFWGGLGAFYGQLVPFKGEPGLPPFDIKYMSGGPIFSVERNESGNLDYRLYGIQSARHRFQKEIIRATGVDVFVRIMDEVLKRLNDKASQVSEQPNE